MSNLGRRFHDWKNNYPDPSTCKRCNLEKPKGRIPDCPGPHHPPQSLKKIRELEGVQKILVAEIHGETHDPTFEPEDCESCKIEMQTWLNIVRKVKPPPPPEKICTCQRDRFRKDKPEGPIHGGWKS